MTNIDKFINNIICPKGVICNMYSQQHTEFASSVNDIKTIIETITDKNNIIFIRNGSTNRCTDLQIFADHLHLIRIPVILITTDGDRSMPSTHDYNKVINKLLSSDIIIRWYTQNYDKSIIHPKLTYIPIGFDLHTMRWLVNGSVSGKVEYMIKSRIFALTNKRISGAIFCDAHLTVSHPDRLNMYDALSGNKNVHFLEDRISFTEITDTYNKYNFALSPRGNGLDCHRTWELFMAGIIVITRTSALDEMYIKNNLPVVILNDWNELNDDLENKLERWFTVHKDKTNIANIMPRLTFDYWLN